MSVAEVQRAMLRLCFARTVDPADLERVGGEPARLYRTMVRVRLRELIASVLPRTESVLGAAATTSLFEAFLDEAPPRSRFFRDVVPDFLAFVLPRLRGPTYPASAHDVATLEGTQWELGWRHLPIDESPIVGLDLALVPVLHPTLRVLRLEHAVHRPLEPGQAPAAGEFFVSVHRRPDSLVETRALDATTSRLVRGWSEGTVPAIETVRSVLAELGREPDAAFVQSMSALLAALVESGAVLGSRPA